MKMRQPLNSGAIPPFLLSFIHPHGIYEMVGLMVPGKLRRREEKSDAYNHL